MIASSRASAHKAAELTGPSDTKPMSSRLASSTAPPPQAGCSGRPTRRAIAGVAIETSPKRV